MLLRAVLRVQAECRPQGSQNGMCVEIQEGKGIWDTKRAPSDTEMASECKFRLALACAQVA